MKQMLGMLSHSWPLNKAFICGLLLLLPHAGLGAEPMLLHFDPNQPKQIQRVQIDQKTLVPFFRSSRGSLHDISLTQDTHFVGVIETKEGTIRNGEYTTPPQHTLRILNERGQTVHTIDSVQRYRFSPDGKQVAYILGQDYEGGVGFVPKGAELLDIKTGRKKAIAGLEDAFELEWVKTPNENAVYFRTLGKRKTLSVLRYDLKRRSLRPTGKNALHISPDGQYYLLKPYEAIHLGLCNPSKSDTGCQRVFHRQTEREVTGLSKQKFGQALDWAYDRGHMLLFAKSNQGRVVDVSTKKTIHTIHENLLVFPKSSRFISSRAQLVEKKPDQSFSIRQLTPQGKPKIFRLLPRIKTIKKRP